MAHPSTVGAEPVTISGMIHVAAIGDEAMWRPVQSRLADAALTCCPESRLDELLPDVDGVLFVDQDPAAQARIVHCLRAGKAVLVSAESWLTGEVLDAFAAAAVPSRAALSIGNPLRFLPSRQLILQQIAAGKLGTPGLVRCQRWSGPARPGHAVPNSESDRDGAAAGGPQLSTRFLRDLDVALAVAGDCPDRVYARQQPLGGAKLLSVHLGFAHGAMALLDDTDGLPSGHGDGYQALTVIGSHGAAYADDQYNQQLLFQENGPRSLRVTEDACQLAAMVRQFVAEPRSETDPEPTIKSWQRVLAVADGIGRSLACGKAVAMGGKGT